MGVCYIVGAGEFSETLSPSASDLVIAADGGCDHLKRIGVTPDVLIGDLDSVEEVPCGIETVKHPVEKDETDSFLAYKLGAGRGYSEFVLLGGTGGRIDHTLANYALLLYAAREGNAVTLIGGGTRVRALVNGKIELFGEKGRGVSVFALGGEAKNVCIKGLKYEAESVNLKPEFPLGVSNSHSDSARGTVSVGDGALLIIEEL